MKPINPFTEQVLRPMPVEDPFRQQIADDVWKGQQALHAAGLIDRFGRWIAKPVEIPTVPLPN